MSDTDDNAIQAALPPLNDDRKVVKQTRESD
jgi:hypothetical protein